MNRSKMCEVFVTTLVAGWLYSGCLAQAQNPQCPTRPFGDNTNACASTAFVQAAASAFAVANHSVVIGTGGNSFRGAAPGDNGNELRSNGSSSDPSFRAAYSLMPEDFGAAATVSSLVDDTPFINSAITAIQTAGGGGLFLRRCYNLLTVPNVITDTSIEISGPNVETGCLQVRNSTGGIRFNSTTQKAPSGGYYTFYPHDFSIIAMDNGATPTSRGECIQAFWPLAADQLPKMLLQNVTCRSETFDATRGSFTRGLHVRQADGMVVENFQWYQIGSTTGYGIFIENSVLPSSYKYTINNVNMNGGQYGIYTTGCLEGLHINYPLLVGQAIGVNADATTCTNTPTIGHNIELELVGGSYNSTTSAVKVQQWFQVSISGVAAGSTSGSVYDISGSGPVTITGNPSISSLSSTAAQISLSDTAQWTVTGNAIGGTGATSTGVKVAISGATWVPGGTVAGNVITGSNTCIDATNAREFTIVGNTCRGGTVGIVANGSSLNGRVEGNTIQVGTATLYSLAGGTFLISQDIATGPSSFHNSSTYTWSGGVSGFQWNSQNNGIATASLSNAGVFFARSTIRTGVAGTTAGSFLIDGLTSGTVTQTGQAVAGTPTVTWGTSSGTPAVTATSPLAITAATGNITCSTCLTSASTLNLVVGTTTISSGTTTRILFDNAGVLGEYTLTGTGTVVAMQTAPTFITSIQVPLHIGGTETTGSQLQLKSTTGNGTTDSIDLLVGNNGAVNVAKFQSGSILGLSIAQAAFASALPGVGVIVMPSNGAVSGASAANAASREWYFSNDIIAFGDFGFKTGSTKNAFDLTRVYVSAAGGLSINNTTDAGAGGVLAAGAIKTTVATASTSKTTGSIIAGGGLGVAGATFTDTLNIITVASTAQTNVLCWNSGTGLVTFQTFATGCTVSSAKYKQDITSFAPKRALEIASALHSISYRYRPEFDLGDDLHFGFLAEEVAKIEPRLATQDAVKYQEFAPIWAGAIQQLKADNDNLRFDVEVLKKQRRTK